MVIAWTLASNPSDSYLECNGQAVNSNKYPKLYALMKNVPDYRGVFLRGLGGNSASLGVLQGDAIRNITGNIQLSNLNDASQQFFGEGTKSNGVFKLTNYMYRHPSDDNWGSYNLPGGFSFDASQVVPTAEENRPVNKAVRYFIKAK